MIRTRSSLNTAASFWIRRTNCLSFVGRRSFTSHFSSGPKPFNLRKELDRIQNLHTSEDQFIQEITAKKPEIEESIFCNQEIDFSEISIYGFDFDFVLASYTTQLQILIYDLVKNILVKEKSYPKEFLDFQYDPNFSIRGLHFDCKLGVLLKIDFNHTINTNTVYYGRKRLPPDEIAALYPGLHIPHTYVENNLRHICDLFELSECTFLADIVQYFSDRNIEYSPAAVFKDVNAAVQIAHNRDLHDAMRLNPGHYVERKPQLGQLLANLRDNEKQLFLLTNNVYKNVDYLMNFIVDLPSPYKHWSELFDVIMTHASKPLFFTSNRLFREQEGETLLWSPVKSLEKGKVYREGSLRALHALKDWDSRGVLYMGDHIHNDLIDAVKHWGWRTCAIIKELDEAITCHNSREYRTLLAHYEQLIHLRAKVLKYPHFQPDEGSMEDLNSAIQKLTFELMKIRHPNFGCIFKSGSKETTLALQLLRFADLYTSQVENVLDLPPQTKFTPRRRLMAHDISIYY